MEYSLQGKRIKNADKTQQEKSEDYKKGLKEGMKRIVREFEKEYPTNFDQLAFLWEKVEELE